MWCQQEVSSEAIPVTLVVKSSSGVVTTNELPRCMKNHSCSLHEKADNEHVLPFFQAADVDYLHPGLTEFQSVPMNSGILWITHLDLLVVG